ncbi:SOS response-associated peptidase [Chondrinema litorale]|uniref:SOS response-associated peptidase n=1 Tax=Chondrinema litorale TaxID=2994555 RepID=UPI002542E701|nr:SOS response-associated peptidase [Chondrinema litorale]UZR93372.1 SOS response-associated peptidase [Chondrinema litorale]
MCGRFTLVKEKKQIEERFDAKFDGDLFRKNYNASPGSFLSVITNDQPKAIQPFHWGLVPSWAKNMQMAFKTINARKETIQEKPAFKFAYDYQRCLVLADGYYEWKMYGKNKVPYRITLKNDSLFAMAGLWEKWEQTNGNTLHSFSIVTIPAISNIAHIHDRMPVILSRINEQKWLDTELPGKQIYDELVAPPTSDIKFYTVSQKVNKADNNAAELIEPHAHSIQGSLF